MSGLSLRSVANDGRKPDERRIAYLRKRKQEEPIHLPVSDDRIPVIVGIGEIVDRPKEITEGLAAASRWNRR